MVLYTFRTTRDNFFRYPRVRIRDEKRAQSSEQTVRTKVRPMLSKVATNPRSLQRRLAKGLGYKYKKELTEE